MSPIRTWSVPDFPFFLKVQRVMFSDAFRSVPEFMFLIRLRSVPVFPFNFKVYRLLSSFRPGSLGLCKTLLELIRVCGSFPTFHYELSEVSLHELTSVPESVPVRSVSFRSSSGISMHPKSLAVKRLEKLL